MLRDKRFWWAGGLVAVLVALIALAAPMGSMADHHEKPKTEMGASNHFKCYDVLDWGPYGPTRVELEDQFGKSVARVMEPYQLCNPVNKNGEGIADKDYHLVCYRIQDDPSGTTERVKEVQVQDQSYTGPLWVGMSEILCMPAKKSYDARG